MSFTPKSGHSREVRVSLLSKAKDLGAIPIANHVTLVTHGSWAKS
jgi:hypothetical protein